jgi:hypothetical protein
LYSRLASSTWYWYGSGSPLVNKHKGTDQMIRSLWFLLIEWVLSRFVPSLPVGTTHCTVGWLVVQYLVLVRYRTVVVHQRNSEREQIR